LICTSSLNFSSCSDCTVNVNCGTYYLYQKEKIIFLSKKKLKFLLSVDGAETVPIIPSHVLEFKIALFNLFTAWAHCGIVVLTVANKALTSV
jgi:hypothetical protein